MKKLFQIKVWLKLDFDFHQHRGLAKKQVKKLGGVITKSLMLKATLKKKIGKID